MGGSKMHEKEKEKKNTQYRKIIICNFLIKII